VLGLISIPRGILEEHFLSASFPSLSRWWLYQLFYAAIALAVYAILWAVGQQPDPPSVLLFAFALGNLNTIAIDLMRPRLSGYKPVYDWLMFSLAEFCLIPLFFLLTTLIGFRLFGPAHMTPPFWRYVATGWKMPVLMAFLFGVAYNFFRRASECMEQRNRELQHAVEREVAGRELQEQDLERAREIQQALLPKEIAQVPGFEVIAAWEPARLVGGDYYDVIRLSDTKLVICIADVVGKGVSAALLMANVQATVRAYASEQAAPSWLCRRVNEVLCNNLAPDKFVTLFYGVLDAESRTLQYTNAGHLPPLLVRSDGSWDKLSTGGAVLGVFREWNFTDAVAQLAPRDRLLLFTDGITEAARLDGEEFGENGVLKTVQSGAALSPGELKTHLLAEVHQFCNSQLHDDATLLLIAAQATKHDRQALPDSSEREAVSHTAASQRAQFGR
jgi:sigma-B regulation protein RsbU (phosphoserine phosphatase)